MKQRSQNFILGLAFIAFFGLFMATILFLYPMFRLPGQTLLVYFHHNEGLTPLKAGSQVLLGGAVEIGKVTRVDVAEIEDPNSAKPERRTVFLVTAQLNWDFTQNIWGDAQITTDQPALGGSGFLSILQLGSEPTGFPIIRFPNGKTLRAIHGQPPQSLQSAIGGLSRRVLGEGGLMDLISNALRPDVDGSPMQKIAGILDDLKATSTQVRMQMSPTDQTAMLAKLGVIVDDVAAMTAALRRESERGDPGALAAKIHVATDRLNESIGEVTNMLREERPVIHETLGNVNETARTVNREFMGVVRAELDPTSSTSLLGKTHRAMDQVNVELAKLIQITETGERIMNVNRPLIEQALTSLVGASQNAEQLTLQLMMNPGQLLWGGTTSNEQLSVFLSARSFATAASDLNESAQRLQAILSDLPDKGPPPKDVTEEIEKVQAGVRAAFERFRAAEDALFSKLR